MASAICSYTMKTLMLWACENKPPSFWSKNAITASVTELLSELIEWLIDGRCQNYFIPSNNMFEYPMGDVELTLQILSSVVCNESKIAEVIAKSSIPNPEVYFPIELSDKLSLLAQFVVNRMSQFVNPLETVSDNSVSLDQLAAGGSEFQHLVTGLIANFQAASDKRIHVHRTDTNGDSVRMARFHLHQSTLTSPQTNSETLFYLDKSILENIPNLIGRKKPRHRVCIYNRKEEPVSPTVVEAHKISKVQVPSGFDMTTGSAVHWFIQGVEKCSPKASYFISAAYRANFYFTYLKQYGECLRICDEAEKRFNALRNKGGARDLFNTVCSVVLTRTWSVIFDKCIQTVFGFILLHNGCLKRKNLEIGTSVFEFQSLHSFVIYIFPMAFIRYVANQCNQRLLCIITRKYFVTQYLECSALLLKAVWNDQFVRLTMESHKYLRTLSRKAAKGILNTDT